MVVTKVVLDTGPLVAYLNRNDQYHEWAVEQWRALTDPLWTCEAVLSEVVFLLQADGSDADPVLRLLDRGVVLVRFALDDHRADIARLLRKYADQGMSLADACLVRMSELVDPCRIFTTDADFRVYRRSGRHVIPLLAPFRR